MMGYSNLCLILLLTGDMLAQGTNDNKEQSPTCLLTSRFKTNRRYMYQYTTESRNSVLGTADLTHGPKVSCQVELEVPQMCSFIMHTRNCVLSEVWDPQGQPVRRHAANSEAFEAAMEKSALKFTVGDTGGVKLYPEEDQPVNILNIKRGIVSALMVPVMEDDQNSLMSTVHGQCSTDYLVNVRKDIDTDVNLSRDLSQCDHFYSRQLANSPLALLQKLHRPMSTLITSTQDCNYQFDNKGRHITTAVCTEKHIYLPFYTDNGISSVVTQDLSFQSSRRFNNTEFDVDLSQSMPLHFEDPEDKSPVQTADSVLNTLRELVALSGTEQGQQRAGLFHRLVSTLRSLRNHTLSQAVGDMLDTSGWLTWQALLQCGTAECSSAMLQAVRTVEGVSLEVDALVYGLSLQADPDTARVRDLLSMAQYKQSKAIMYALANTVKKFHKGEVTPVITDVSEFMKTLLNDCSGESPNDDSNFPVDPDEMSFLVLRVVGVMGQAMQTVSPSLISSILTCARKTDIPLPNQKAAIQALRLMDINDEIRNVLLEEYKADQSPMEKRVTAYIMLMKNPDQELVTDVMDGLEYMTDKQLKSFVVSHLTNIHNSNDPQTHQFRAYIESALRDALSNKGQVINGNSRNYKIESPLGSIQSNILFDETDTLPKEVMLETTLKVFDYHYDIFEVGVEGSGFEPTLDALFGEKGFLPDSISKVMYWAEDNAQMLKGLLNRISPNRDRMKRKVSQGLLNDMRDGFQKLMDDVGSSPAPEAISYLRLLGHEIGYMKTGDMRKMAETLSMYFHFFIRTMPSKMFSALTSSTENEVFAHYIFMENSFSLPTTSGLPLKFSLAGVFAPGAKGGLTLSRSGTNLSFMPSVGLEFITQMGVHIPDYAEAGLQMHTNMYHESSLNAKVTILNSNQIRLSIPAPRSNTRLLSVSNKLMSVSTGQMVPSPDDDRRADTADCQPLLSGLKLCTIVYSNVTSKFAVELQPTGEVSEYTATITEKTLREGKRGRHKTDTLKLTLKAEGDDSSEATATLKYNHHKNILTTELVIPDYDVEVGIKLAADNSNVDGQKMRGFTMDVTNRNIPQLTLVGRTRLDTMKDAMLQLQMVVPSLKSDASVTATLRKDEAMLVDLETNIQLPETFYLQKATLKYDDDKVELELISDLSSEIQKMIPSLDDHHRELQLLIDHILDQKVAKTDMKLRHIVTKGIEAGNIWLDKLKVHIPEQTKLRSKRSITDLTLPDLPEKLFLRCDSLFRYQFNKDKIRVSLPEVNIPTTLSMPVIDLPEIGLYIPAKNYRLPPFSIPPSFDFPLLGLAEASTKINSNLYSWEGSISGGNNTVDVPSYIVQYKAIARSPFNLLSYKLEGTGMMSGRADDNIKYLLNSTFSHSLVDTGLSISERLRVTDKLNANANYKLAVSSPLGMQASLYYSAQSTSNQESSEVSGDGTVDGLLQIGSLNTNASYTHTYNLRPLDREGGGKSTLDFNAPFIQVHNVIVGTYANSELNIVSKTNAQNDIMLTHIAELKYTNTQLTLKCNAVLKAMGKSLLNQIILGVSSNEGLLRIESQTEDETMKTMKQVAHSLITGSLDSNGIEVISEGSLMFDTGHRGLHKASLMVGKNGLTTSGTNTIQGTPVTVENNFNGAIDMNGATLSSWTKAMAEEGRGEMSIEAKITDGEASLYGTLKGHAYDSTTRNDLNVVLNRRALMVNNNALVTLKQIRTESSNALTLTLWTLALHSKTNCLICEDVYYKQDTRVGMKPWVMSSDMTNDVKLYDFSLNNEGHMKLEPIKMDLSGSTKGSYGEEHNIKHTYELKYDNMAGTMKYSTSGNVRDARMNHNCELEFAGLSAKSNCEAQINSEPLRFDSTIRTMAVPLSLTVDALVNSDGEVNLHGKHSGQLFSKLLLKAEPLALAYSHESRVSTTHMLSNGESSTNSDNKVDGLLTSNDQSLTWKVKSKLNNHAYDQAMSAYNNPEKIGLEFSGVMLTDIFSKFSEDDESLAETQEFSMVSFLRYDKNSECNIIYIPFVESLPAAFEQLKDRLVNVLETLQSFITNLNIDQLINDSRARLDQLPRQVSELMQDMDLENRVNQVKTKLDYLINEFSVTMDDFEDLMNNVGKNLKDSVIDTATKISGLILIMEDYVKSGQLAEKITNVVSQIGNGLLAFDQKHEIKQSLIKVLDAIQDIIGQIDLHKLTDSTVAWLRELDSKYGILDKIKDTLTAMKQAVENFDIRIFFQDVKNDILSLDLAWYVEQLSFEIEPTEIAKMIESMNDVILNWIDEYEIPNKLNTVYFYIRDLLLKYNLDDKFNELMDQIVILIQELKIDKTVHLVVDAVKSINFELVHDKIMQFLHSMTNQLRTTDFRKSINDLNEHISSMLKTMKEFDYAAFVDENNRKISELTDYLNDKIKTYEIVEKIEAIREFFREFQSSIYAYLDQLKNTKVVDALKKLNYVIDTTLYKDIVSKGKDIVDDIRQRILDMDIREEMYVYLQRASESYSNMVAFISTQFNILMEKIGTLAMDSDITTQIKQAINEVLSRLETAEIKVPTFTIPLTDLIVPAFTINLNKLQEISIQTQISVPEFTILNFYTIPAYTIDFNEIKAKIVAVIDNIREYEIQTPDLEEIFGDLKVLYLSELPDLTFPQITLSEIKFPTISIPKLNLADFDITMLPIPQIKLPEVPQDICIPVFGKFHGEFRVNSPHYILVTAGKIENSTSTPEYPQFTGTITSHAKSPIEYLEYNFEASAQLEAPRMKKLLFTETVRATHITFSVDHEGSLTLTDSAAGASAKTTAKKTTHMYMADLTNEMAITIDSRISTTINTTYNYSLDIPKIETSSQASMKQNIAAILESGRITVTGENTCNGKWSIQDYSDEGIHKSNAVFNMDFSTAKLSFVEETDCKAFKSMQTLTAESVMLSHTTVEAKIVTEVESVMKSISLLKGEVHIGDLRVELKASHDADLFGSLIGSMANSLEFLAHPFEILLSAKNKMNSKISLPLTLIGKVDLQQDYGFILNPEKQHGSWLALARFNQYRYNHNFTTRNSDVDILLHGTAGGEANLDFLTVPVSIPEITIPYLNMKTLEVRDLSLWEHAGFKTLLTSPQQSFDMNVNLHYHKNPDVKTFALHFEPFYKTISDNANIIKYHFEEFRDKVVPFLKDANNKAKLQYIKHKIDTSNLPPRIFTVPRYKIPVLNIEVSAFSAEMPAFSYFVPKEVSTPSFKVPALGFSLPSYTLVLPSLGFPVIHVPDTLSEIQLPSFALPAIQNNIEIPLMGNITGDISFRSILFTFTANGGLYNLSDIVAQFGASSTSVFDILNGKIESTTTLTRKRGMKLATTVSLEHNNVGANYACALSLTKRSMKASVSNSANISLSFLTLELTQELNGNIENKLNITSKNMLNYMFDIPRIESVGKGNFNMNWALEALPSHLSMETTTQGQSDVRIMDSSSFDGELKQEASFYLDANHLRSAVMTASKSTIDKVETQKRSSNNIFFLDMNKNLVIEVSLRGLSAKVDYTSNNNVDFSSFNTNGKHIVEGELHLVPLTTFRTALNIDASQPSSLGHAGLVQNINLAISPEKQSFSWTGREQLANLIHTCDLCMSNDESEIRMDLTQSVEGHLAFLKSIKLPVYQKTLWDVLKFDQVTHLHDLQILNISSSIVYTKNMDCQEYKMPSKLFENGIIFSIPVINIAVPFWVKDIPLFLNNVDVENPDVHDHLTLPPVIKVPAFDVPFTNLHMEPYTIDPQNINVPELITTKAFEIMLPGLPIISVPSYNVETAYLQRKMSYLSFKIPTYEITVSSFTLPKSFTIEEQTIGLNEIIGKISNFKLPTINIPEQKIEIPEIALYIPTSVCIPAFGGLSATLKVSSPIYNVSTSANVEKKDSSVITVLNSICTSTMIFLEYDLTANATIGFDHGDIHFVGKSNIIHNDANIDWQHVLIQSQRESLHTLNVDITSPTFADASFRFASRKDGITSSVSSPSCGFLGLQFQRRTSQTQSQLYGKLFSRYMSTADKDTDVLTTKFTLRNAEKLLLHTSWNWDFLHDVIEGTKDRVPAATDAMLKFINKYHRAHFGFDLNRGGMKLKNTASNFIEMAYMEFPISFNSMQNSMERLSSQGKDMYKKSSDRLMSISAQDVTEELANEARQVLKHTEDKVDAFLIAATQFLSDTKCTVPGSDKKLSCLDLVQQACQSVSRATETAIQLLASLLEKMYSFIKELQFPIPKTDFVVSGNEIIESLKFCKASVSDQLRKTVHRGFHLLQRAINYFFLSIAENGENVITYLKDENIEIASRVDAIYAEVLQSSNEHVLEARRSVAEYKDLSKLKIQETYNALTMENVNNGTKELISIFQSHLYGGLNEGVDLLRRTSVSTAPYIRVSNKKMDIEIPLFSLGKPLDKWLTKSK